MHSARKARSSERKPFDARTGSAERRGPGDPAVFDVACQQLGDDAILVGAGEQRRRLSPLP
ncbi:hypothetical protein CTI14_43500, partial [Methylobacterium radiotolerans]